MAIRNLMFPLICAIVFGVSVATPGIVLGQECQTFADIQVKAADLGDTIVVDLRGHDAEAFASILSWPGDVGEFDEIVIIHGTGVAHVIIMLFEDCTTQIVPAAFPPEALRQAVEAIIGVSA